jgi:hypothetical protein
MVVGRLKRRCTGDTCCVSNNAAMNRMFLAAARRGERAGALARLTGSPPPDTDTPRSERLTRLLADVEDAKQAGDADALALTELRIDHLFKESRAARKPDESDPGEQPGWDGGVRGRRSPPQRGLGQESASSLFVAAMQASKQERAERDADSGQTIIATNNF